jgi:MFS superfamily sulfate permease-like transporter
MGAMTREPSEPSEPSEPIIARLVGHLTRAQLEQVLAEVAEQLREREHTPVLLDCSAMDGYDLDARHAFVDWNKHWKAHVSRVAIVTSNRLYHVVIATMSLASGQAMKGFAEREQALGWARNGHA